MHKRIISYELLLIINIKELRLTLLNHFTEEVKVTIKRLQYSTNIYILRNFSIDIADANSFLYGLFVVLHYVKVFHVMLRKGC